MAIIWIDLGTTNSLVSHFTEDGPSIIPNRLGDLLTPSVVSIDENEKTGKFNACVKGEAIATLAEGTTTEKFTILGIEFEVEQTGYIGGIGLEGEFGIVEGKLKGEMVACALIGGNISVSIGLAD